MCRTGGRSAGSARSELRSWANLGRGDCKPRITLDLSHYEVVFWDNLMSFKDNFCFQNKVPFMCGKFPRAG